MTHIRIITPSVVEGLRSLDDIAGLGGPGLTFSHVALERGPSSIEGEYDHVIAAPDVVRRAVESEADGVDAIVIDCMGDPGLQAARERVSIPVVGPGEASMHLAAMLAHRFAIVTILEAVRPMLGNLARVYGVADKLAAIRVVDMPVLELTERRVEVIERLTENAVRCIEDNHAGVIVLGCTGFFGCADAIAAALAERGLIVPVIDPIPAAACVAEALVKARLTHSRHSYPSPREKRVVGY